MRATQPFWKSPLLILRPLRFAPAWHQRLGNGKVLLAASTITRKSLKKTAMFNETAAS